MSRLVFAFAVVCLAATQLFAAGGTSIVAQKGEPAHISESWPDGVEALVNDPARTTGWNSWFSEWPNDVQQFGFEIESTKDLNRLLNALAVTKCEIRQLRLSYLKEPQSLGWVTRLPENNGVPVVFSIGNQAQIDRWYKNVRKPFGVMQFLAAPVAVPPTLTIFVQNKAVDLEKLKIPKGISVSAGYVPTVFHRWNTKQEQELEKKVADKPQVNVPKLKPAAQQAADRIKQFLEDRQKGQ